MPCTLSQAHDQILARLRAALPSLPIRFPDRAGATAKPPQTSWARVTLTDTQGDAATLVGSRGNRRYRNEGILTVQLFAMSGDGRTAAQELGEAVLSAYRGASTSGGVQFRRERVVDVGPDGTYYHVNAIIEYWYDSFGVEPLVARDISGGMALGVPQIAGELTVEDEFDPQLISAASTVQNQPLPFSGAGTDGVIVSLGAFLADDLIVVAVNAGDRSLAEVIAEPSGWTRIAMGGGTSGTGGSRTDVFYRRMKHAEEPASVAFFGALRGVGTPWTARRWTWRNTDPSKVPVAVGLLPGASASRTLNGPAITSGFGAVRTGWMQLCHLDRQDSSAGATPGVTAFPAGYLDPVTDTTNVTHPPYSVLIGCAQGSCYKTEASASQLAGSWTFLPSVAGSIAPVFFTAIAVGGN